MRIRRRTIHTDSQGRVISEQVEQLTEDTDQNVEEIHANSYWRCEACGRPVDKVQDIRDRCVECGRQSCATCAVSCAICSRPICGNGHCRRGFAEKGLSVCHCCLDDLSVRLAREDRLLDEKIKFERSMAIYQTLLKLTQSGSRDAGSLSDVWANITQIRLTRKLSRLAKQLEQEQRNERRLLP